VTNTLVQRTRRGLRIGPPRLDNIVAEATWAVYKKVQEVFGFGSSSVGELNLALEAIAAAQGALYNTNAHSAGNFGVAEMNRRLEAAGRTDAAIGTQTMFGSPVNAQDQADRVHAITSGQGTVKQSSHVNDFVSTLFGNNPQTGGEENTPALRSHSAYTGDLTTSGSDQPQVQIPSFITPEELRQRTDEAWSAGQFSQPATVTPRNSVEPNQEN
jgi:hypothetical protein